jgi:hypothetical protein
MMVREPDRRQNVERRHRLRQDIAEAGIRFMVLQSYSQGRSRVRVLVMPRIVVRQKGPATRTFECGIDPQ